MELTEQQKQTVATWLEEGMGLSEVQRRLADDFDLRMTFMDVRFLVLDLGLEVRDKDEPTESDAPVDGDAELSETEPSAAPASGQDLPPVDGSLSVDVDVVTKPGAVVSGRVVFSDGESAGWFLDQMGRLGLDPSTEGYRPSEEDIAKFQEELKTALAKRGF